MKYTLADRFMWLFLKGVCLKTLKTEHPEWDYKYIAKTAKQTYRSMVEQTPSIGSYSENSLKKNLTGGMVWIAVFEAAREKYGDSMTTELYEKMCRATIAMPMMLKAAKRMKPFTAKFQQKAIEKARCENQIDSPYNWHTKIVQGKVDEEFTVIYTKCGLCRLAKERGHSDILPAMCRTDYIMFEAMGAILHRDKTLSNGDDCCYYYCTKPGSEAEKTWLSQHPEGTFKPV